MIRAFNTSSCNNFFDILSENEYFLNIVHLIFLYMLLHILPFSVNRQQDIIAILIEK